MMTTECRLASRPPAPEINQMIKSKIGHEIFNDLALSGLDGIMMEMKKIWKIAIFNERNKAYLFADHKGARSSLMIMQCEIDGKTRYMAHSAGWKSCFLLDSTDIDEIVNKSKARFRYFQIV